MMICFSITIGVLFFFLQTVNGLLFQAQVSIGRIGKFLQNGDLDPDNVQHNPNAGEFSC